MGFQEHYEIPSDSELVEVKVEIECELSQEAAFSLIGEAKYLSEWFYKIVSLDSKPGGKIKFLDSDEKFFDGLCTSYRPGKEISMLSGEFGEFTGVVRQLDGKVQLQIQLKSYETDPEAKLKAFNTCIHRLQELAW